MPLSDALKNLLVDAIDTNVTHISIHTDYDAAGGNEASGGSPAYAREALAIDAAANGEGDQTGTIEFDLPAGTYNHIGFWSAITAGTFYGMVPMGGGSQNPPIPVQGRNTGDVIEANGHGLSNDDNVIFYGPNLPTGITEGTIYFVISSNTNDFQVSATQGGAAVTLSGDGVGIAHKVVEETLNAQGNLTVNTQTFGFNLLT